MRVFRSLEAYNLTEKSCVTIGTFDGVHIGHQKVLKHLITKAKEENLVSVLLTFFPHPRMVLQQNFDFKLINTIEERIERLAQTGLDAVIIQEFSTEFSEQRALSFMKETLIKKLNISHLIVGHDHRFGKNREGNYTYLQECGTTYGFKVSQISKEEINEIAVSSTKIRQALNEGKIETVNTYLGYPFTLSGIVTTGQKIGSKIGFPTANIALKEDYKILPKDGVYTVKVKVLETSYFGMMNIGYRPTVNGKNRTIEVHLFNCSEDLYQKEIAVQPIHFLRSEKKFSSIEELKKQLHEDKDKALNLLQK